MNPYRSTLDHLLEGFQIIGVDWTYLYVNPVAAEHGRSTPAALSGIRIQDAYPGIETSPLFATLARVMTERHAVAIENLFTYPDGTQRWFELRIEPVPEGIVVHSLDIEDRKRAEADLLRAYAELEQRVTERTQELAASNRELEAFGETVAHDLRAPVRAIEGFSRALFEDFGVALGERGNQHVERITTAAQRMRALIEDLLTLARLGRTELSRTDVNISAIARVVADELQVTDPTRRVQWKITAGLRAKCDPGLTRIVFENLLGNAWKFTARRLDAIIEVRASADAPHAFVVVDNGAGFDMESSARMFRPFQRLHSSSEFTGTGIGLATVQRILERHGGTVAALGAVNHGAQITVSFGR